MRQNVRHSLSKSSSSFYNSISLRSLKSLIISWEYSSPCFGSLIGSWTPIHKTFFTGKRFSLKIFDRIVVLPRHSHSPSHYQSKLSMQCFWVVKHNYRSSEQIFGDHCWKMRRSTINFDDYYHLCMATWIQKPNGLSRLFAKYIV